VLASVLPVESRTSQDGDASRAQRLTQTGLLRLDLFPAPASVAHLVTTFYRVRCDEPAIRDVHPSSIGALALMKRGTGNLNFIDGRVAAGREFMVIAPTTGAAIVEVDGPWEMFGAMLSPVGWASLTGLNASTHLDRLFAGEAVMPPPVAAAAGEILRNFDALTPPAMIDRLAEAMAASARPIRPRHAAFIGEVADWLAKSLSPLVEDLYDSTGYSPRQVQRLAERYFGLPPITIARKYRALRAAVILSRPDLPAEEAAAVEDHFYDQSHMIREMRLFSGRTPARIADPDTPYLSAFMDVRDFTSSGPRLAPIPRDLRT
jgi:AraC-like DNA-binding protein